MSTVPQTLSVAEPGPVCGAPLGHGGCPGSPEQEIVGEIEETHLMPATARFCGVAQQHGAEVGVHGFRERLQVSVEESPGAGDKEMREQLPKGDIHVQAPSSPNLRVPGLQFLVGNGGLWKTGSNELVSLLSPSTTTTSTIYCAKHNDLTSFFGNSDG